MLTLAVDASTYVGTVALLDDDQVIAASTAAMRGEREERLMPAIVELLAATGIGVEGLEAIACGGGPGSFTSLRIAASIAKGVAAARRIPLFVAASPLLIVAGAAPRLDAGRYIAVLDAMRGDVFALPVTITAQTLVHVDGAPQLMSRSAVEGRAASLGAELIGPNEGRQVAPHARGFALLMAQQLTSRVDVETWEPDYGRKAEAQVRWELAHGIALETR